MPVAQPAHIPHPARQAPASGPDSQPPRTSRSRIPMSEPEISSEIPNRHTTAGKLADLQRRIDEATHAGSARAVEKQHAKGKLTARER
ncbi:hypothetical protein, partial [Streptomyces sparsogenes]|uniref:hypothetical protein n=1 Tax=Streptomyces sparsogenes TaxID=67365 RepID=UPI003F4D0C15